MATGRIIRLSLHRTRSINIQRPSCLPKSAALAYSTPLIPSIHKHQPFRAHSTEVPTKSKPYQFPDVKSLASAPRKSHILIDVREPHEYAAGYIPTAHNVPITSQPDAFFLPPEEFEERFGFALPAKDGEEEMVFYCRSGVRSSAAARLAEQAGWARIGEYRGSWNEWTEKGGEKAGGS